MTCPLVSTQYPLRTPYHSTVPAGGGSVGRRSCPGQDAAHDGHRGAAERGAVQDAAGGAGEGRQGARQGLGRILDHGRAGRRLLPGDAGGEAEEAGHGQGAAEGGQEALQESPRCGSVIN